MIGTMEKHGLYRYTLKDVKESAARGRFTVISCFAGGGGSSTGYKLSGGNVLLVNEFVEEAILSYKSNYPETPVLVDDIKKYSGEDFLKMVGNLSPGELDILDGSPPCSAFSIAGNRESGWKGTIKNTKKSYFQGGEVVRTGDSKVSTGIKKYSDGKTVEAIEDLFFEFIRVAEGIKPKVIIAENVKGITLGEAKKKYAEIINSFRSIGYSPACKVLNSADYGVPQTRERAIFVAVRNDIVEALNIHPILFSSKFFPAPSCNRWISIEEAIDDVINDPDEVKELVDFYEGSFQKGYMDNIPFRPSKITKPSDKQFRSWNPKASCFNMVRPAPNLPCPTLTQQGQRKGLSGIFHYDYNRKLTIKEMMRIMSLPEDYVLTGTFDQKAERIGRMVTPLMMKSVADNVYSTILEPYNGKK